MDTILDLGREEIYFRRSQGEDQRACARLSARLCFPPAAGSALVSRLRIRRQNFADSGGRRAWKKFAASLASGRKLTQFISHLNSMRCAFASAPGSEGSQGLLDQDLIADRSQPTGDLRNSAAGPEATDHPGPVARAADRDALLYEDLSLVDRPGAGPVRIAIGQMRTTIIERPRTRLKGREQELAA